MSKATLDIFFKKCLEDVGINKSEISKFSLGYDYILNQYAHPSRYYHNSDHIIDLFKKYERYLTDTGSSSSPELKWAIMFHDVVYDLSPSHDFVVNEFSWNVTYLKTTNESKSKNLFKDFITLLHSLNIKTQLKTEKTANIIKDTEYNITRPNLKYAEVTSHLMHDLDFSGIGESWEIFSKNSENIRKEFWWVKDEDFKEGRKKFLSTLTDGLFITDYFIEKYEAKAQENIKKELEILNEK